MEESRESAPGSPRIYSAVLKFRKTPKNERILSVQIRYAKRGKPINERLPFPGDLRDDELYWVTFQGELISVYHRLDDNYSYLNSTHPDNTHTNKILAQKLENIVREAIRRNKKK